LFLAIAAVLAWLFGAMLLVAPGAFYSPTGIAMTPMLATVAQAHGATLIGLGVIDWFARRGDIRGIRAVLAGNLVAQLLSLGVVIRTMSLGAGAAVAPGIVIHVVLAGAFGAFLVKAPTTSRAA
jgi:hypothetical protein